MKSDRDADIDLIAVFTFLWSRRFFIGGIALSCAIAAGIYAFLATPMFRAEVAVTEVNERGINGASLASQFSGLASLAGVNLGQGGGNRDWRAILQSRRLVEEFVSRNNLIPTLYPKAKRPPTLWKAVNYFRGDVLDIKEDTRKGVTTLAIEWTDAQTAARWANAFVALANEIIRTEALDESKRNIAYLTDQVTHTNVVELQRVLYSIIESETKTYMVANGRIEYAFRVVDPAVASEIKSKPQRSLLVLLGGVAGVVLGSIIVLIRMAIARSKERSSGLTSGLSSIAQTS